MSQVSQQRHAKELWLSLEEFEKQLQDDRKSYEFEIESMKFNYQVRERGLREKCLLRIEGLELALNHCKL